MSRAGRDIFTTMEFIVEGDARAEIALRNSWAHVADILEERVAKSLGQFEQGTHQKKDLRFMHVLRERPLLCLGSTCQNLYSI